MAERTWFGNHGIVKFAIAGQTPTAVSLCKDLEVTITGEYEELYAMGSTLRQDIAIHTKKCTCKFKLMKWDPQDNIIFLMLDPSWTSGSVTMAGTCDVALYDVDIWLDRTETSDGTNNLKFHITNVYFENLPMSISETEWIGLELNGIGAGVTMSNTVYS